MLHMITLFTVPVGEDQFVRSLRMNGDWHTVARRIAPELITPSGYSPIVAGIREV